MSSPTMPDPKEALERLIAALRERPKGAPGYDDQASSIEHQAADVIDALIAKQEGLERDYADLKSAIGGAATEEQTLRLIIRGYLAQQTAESKAEGLEREVARLTKERDDARRIAMAERNMCDSVMRYRDEYLARAEAAESKLSALETKVAAARVALEDQDEGRQFVRVDNALRALLDPAVPVETAQRTETITRVHLPSDVASIPDAYVDVRSPVPPSQGAAPNVVHHHNIHPWAQPGDRPDRWWRLRFDDQDMREMIWSDPDAEREARAAYAQYSPAWNCYLFATVEARAQAHPDVAGLVEALKLGLELKLSAYPAHGSGFVAILTAGNLDVFQAKAADALAAFQSRQAAR